MFTSFDKAIVAIIMAVLWLINDFIGLSWYGHVSEETIAVVLAAITPFLVWLVPNKQWTATQRVNAVLNR